MASAFVMFYPVLFCSILSCHVLLRGPRRRLRFRSTPQICKCKFICPYCGSGNQGKCHEFVASGRKLALGKVRRRTTLQMHGECDGWWSSLKFWCSIKNYGGQYWKGFTRWTRTVINQITSDQITVTVKQFRAMKATAGTDGRPSERRPRKQTPI